jgi:SAM-dependent methyltransferase
MITPITEGQVDVALAGIPGDTAYIRGMWRYMLEQADRADADVPQSENCDAIPYVPVATEAHGVPLSADSCVLDIGCLGGYGLYDFFMRRERAGLPLPRAVGIDVDVDSVAVASSLSLIWAPKGRVVFREASCTAIPVPALSVDLIVARLVLPYVPLRAAVAELVRVLKPGGVILVQTHSPRYYWNRLWRAFPRVKQMVYYARPLVGGGVFALTGRQIGKETAIGRGTVKQMFNWYGFVCAWEGEFDSKPMMVIKG